MLLSVFRALACVTYPTPTPFGANIYARRDFSDILYRTPAPTCGCDGIAIVNAGTQDITVNNASLVFDYAGVTRLR